MQNVVAFKTQEIQGNSQFAFTNNLVVNMAKLNLKPTTKLVLIYLSTCYNPSHKDVFPKQKTIALNMGISEISVIRAIKELLKEGLILVVPGYRNHYVFTNKLISFCNNKMIDSNDQKERELPIKMIPHEHIKEKEKEQTQNVDISNFSLLKRYAIKKGVKNPTAYANAIIRNGGAEEILATMKEEIKIKENAQRRILETKRLIEEQKNVEYCTEIPDFVKQRMAELRARLKK